MGPGTAFPPIPREDHPVRAACLCNIIKYSTREKMESHLFDTCGVYRGNIITNG